MRKLIRGETNSLIRRNLHFLWPKFTLFWHSCWRSISRALLLPLELGRLCDSFLEAISFHRTLIRTQQLPPAEAIMILNLRRAVNRQPMFTTRVTRRAFLFSRIRQHVENTHHTRNHNQQLCLSVDYIFVFWRPKFVKKSKKIRPEIQFFTFLHKFSQRRISFPGWFPNSPEAS